MIEAVLFDLDGTLLKHHIADFLRRYFCLIQKKFNHLFPDGELVRLMLASTENMLKNNGSKTNKEAFWEDFLSRSPYSFEELEPEFQRFYLEDFPSLKQEISADPQTVEVINKLKKRGYKLVLATNPLFPRLAIEERLRWSGIDGRVFDFLASYESMHYCKPNANFFLEIAGLLNMRPEKCLMVGNDVELDLIPAKAVGMKTFLVENGFEVLADGDFAPDFQGELKELIGFLEEKRSN